MQKLNEEYYYLSFSHCLGIGPMKFDLLLKQFKDAKTAYSASSKELTQVLGVKLAAQFVDFRQKFDPVKKMEEIQKKGIQFISRIDKAYPKALLKIPDPPIALYVKGDLSAINLDKSVCFAIVGTRRPSSYGVQIARKFSSELASSGFIIISGMAIGIDTLAHQGALEAGRKTVAVLGCGVDIVYPPANTNLYNTIVKSGGIVLSEFPPGMTTLPGLFVARNRIISGLSKGVLIVEGLEGSGSLITARYAAEQGKDVFAPPAPLTSLTSFAPNLLLKEGAKLVTKTQDILDEFNLQISPARQKKIEVDLTEDEKKIVASLSSEAKLIDELVNETKMSAANISQLVTLLEIKGVIEKNSEGKYQLT